MEFLASDKAMCVRDAVAAVARQGQPRIVQPETGYLK
jgi:hypothetical protein